MIVANDSTRQDVTIGGALGVNAFTIKASAKAFQILSSNLYSNKLGAMIRELSTNAFDAHVMAGKSDVPFLITLPNSMEPSFKIRDYGTGLSEEQIMSIYTTFFESTKTESNDVVGCLGLGSKSPFGVADSFTITSFYDGTRTVYSAFLDAQGIPSIATFHREDTTEPNGVEIEVAIRSEDFSTFPKEVNRQLNYFTLKPTIEGNSNFAWNPVEEYLYFGSNWKMNKKRDNYAKVVQGQISYPIDTSAMGSKFGEAAAAVRTIFHMPIIFEVPIGAVNIAPSREALTYDEDTINNLLKAAETVLGELPSFVKKTIESAETEWDARLMFYEVMQSIHRSEDLRDRIVEAGILWNGIDVSSTTIFVPKEAIIANNYYNSNRGSLRKESRTLRSNYDYKLGEYTEEKNWTIKVSDRAAFIHIAKDAKSVDGRIKQYIRDNRLYNNDTYIITTDLSIADFEKLLGGPTMLDSSTFDKVRKEPAVKKSEEMVTIQVYTHMWTKMDQWESYDIPKDDIPTLSGVYVNLDRFDVVHNEEKLNNFRSNINSARELKLIDSDTKIYGIRAGNKNLKHNLEYLFDRIQSTTANIDDKELYVFGKSSKFETMFRSYTSQVKELKRHIKEDSPMNIILDGILHNEGHKFSTDTLTFIKKFKVKLTTIDVSDLAEEAQKRYALLPVEIGYSANMKALGVYVDQMDMLHNLTYGIQDPFNLYLQAETQE